MYIPNSNERINIFNISLYLEKKKLISYANEIIQNSTALVHKKVNIKFPKKYDLLCFYSTTQNITCIWKRKDGVMLYKLVSDSLFVIER